MKCPECSRETNNPKFCSRSCAAKHNNRKSPKRKPEHKCLDCGAPRSAQRQRCRSCYVKWSRNRSLENITLEEAVLRYKNHGRASAFALVRTRARAVVKKAGRGSECEWCGYDKHTEVAHRKGISEFPTETKLDEINDPSNLLCLCPNCHWEHDKLNRRE